ncbi:MAG TPA: CHRD domain-containing protein [Rhizomicrobium sp.]|nr:CHRD domain-containing protein [Rhizomicrobium sp.]
MSYFRPTAIAGAAIAGIALLSSGAAMAAGPEAYMINLGPVARTNATKLLAVGRGTADVTLDGTKLTVKGLFNGLASPATDAHVCVGVGIGVMGTCGSDLTVTPGMSGSLSGTVSLNSKQMTALRAGQLYVQINSQKAPAPAGTLWGWILIAHEEVGQDVPQQGHWFLPQYDMPLSAEHGSTHELKTAPNT